MVVEGQIFFYLFCIEWESAFSFQAYFSLTSSYGLVMLSLPSLSSWSFLLFPLSLYKALFYLFIYLGICLFIYLLFTVQLHLLWYVGQLLFLLVSPLPPLLLAFSTSSSPFFIILCFYLFVFFIYVAQCYPICVSTYLLYLDILFTVLYCIASSVFSLPVYIFL